MKKIIMLFAVVCMIGLCAGLGWAAPLKFGLSVATLDNPYFIEVANGFKDQCKNAGRYRRGQRREIRRRGPE